jgi:copper transport protein
MQPAQNGHGKWPCIHGCVRRSRWVATLLACIGAWLLVVPVAAQAHARLTTSYPNADELLTSAPDEVTLTFSGPISVGPDAIQVFAPDGSRVDHGPAQLDTGDTRVVQRIAVTSTATGAFAVGWRVTSRDGHTIRGSFSFTVGTPTPRAASPALQQAQDATRVASGLEIAAAITRGIGFLALLGAAGGVIFGSAIAPQIPIRGIGKMLGVLLVALAATYVLDAAISNGVQLTQALTPTLLAVEAGNPYGRGALVTGALAVLGIVVMPLVKRAPSAPPVPRGLRLIPVVVFTSLAASASLSGHAMAADPLLVRLMLDMLHLVAASLWIGGLLQLRYIAPAAADHATAIIRFSRTAVVCVGVLVGTGIYATSYHVGPELLALDNTTYGHILLAKLVLFATTIPMAWLNMSTLVPALRRNPYDASPILASYITREGCVLVGIVALTAWLTGTDPRV